MYVCFFISDFWWKRFPQNWHGYGRVSIWREKFSEFSDRKYFQTSHGIKIFSWIMSHLPEWINKCVDSVLERLNAFPHCLHSKTFSTLWTALDVCLCGAPRKMIFYNFCVFVYLSETYLCWLKLISCPNVLLHNSQANGRLPLCDRLACTSNPCGVENIFSHFIHE